MNGYSNSSLISRTSSIASRSSKDTDAVISNTSSRGTMVVTEGTTTVLNELEAWTNYSLQVSAATNVGVGVPSLPVVCSTLEDG